MYHYHTYELRFSITPPPPVDLTLKTLTMPTTEEASKLNLWADAYWNAGCRTMEEIAADEQAAASSAEQHTSSTQDARRPVEINVTYTHNHIEPLPSSSLPLSFQICRSQTFCRHDFFFLGG
jgi:hypothetical protein